MMQPVHMRLHKDISKGISSPLDPHLCQPEETTYGFLLPPTLYEVGEPFSFPRIPFHAGRSGFAEKKMREKSKSLDGSGV